MKKANSTIPITRDKKKVQLKKPFLPYILLVLFGLILGLFFSEIAVRMLDHKHLIHVDHALPSDMAIFSPTLIYKNKPYSTRTCEVGSDNKEKIICHINRFGFRDYDYTYKKRFNACRIEIFGDSMTYGLGVLQNDSYPKILEMMINKKNRTPEIYEVMNMGTVGYSVTQYDNLLNEVGVNFSPDIIIVGFHLKTDPLETYIQDLNKKEIFLKGLPDTLVPYGVNQFLKDHSYLYVYVLQNYYSFAHKYARNWQTELFQENTKNEVFYQTQIDTSRPFMKKAWKLVEKGFTDIDNTAKKQDIHAIFVGIPTKEQIVPNEWTEVKKQGIHIDERAYSDPSSRKIFASLCKKHGWKCVDLQNDLRKTADPAALFLKNDFHFSAQGNTVAARTIYAYLKQKNLLNLTSGNCSYAEN